MEAEEKKKEGAAAKLAAEKKAAKEASIEAQKKVNFSVLIIFEELIPSLH